MEDYAVDDNDGPKREALIIDETVEEPLALYITGNLVKKWTPAMYK